MRYNPRALDARALVCLAISEIDRGCNFANADVTVITQCLSQRVLQVECGSKSPRRQVVHELPSRDFTQFVATVDGNSRREKKKRIATLAVLEIIGRRRDHSEGKKCRVTKWGQD